VALVQVPYTCCHQTAPRLRIPQASGKESNARSAKGKPNKCNEIPISKDTRLQKTHASSDFIIQVPADSFQEKIQITPACHQTFSTQLIFAETAHTCQWE
jgi:hypothetical protein